MKCKLKRATKEKSRDELEECITNMFPNSADNDGSDDVNDGETVQVIYDDYSCSTRDLMDTNVNSNNKDTSGSTVTELSLGNIFTLGNEKMIEMKIPSVRERKQDRMLLFQAFFLNVHDIVTSAEKSAESELNSNDSTMIPNPWFRQCYRNISN